MNRSDLVDEVALKTFETKRCVGEVVDAVLEVIARQLAAGGQVALTGFGTFSVASRPERVGRNPKTGELVKIAAHRVPKFSAGTKLKGAVNN